jgi:tripartite-type tricarboxylate transporter receptor subunit TctC
MTPMRRRTLLAAPALVSALPAFAADWPTRPVKLVVTFPPGGSSDLVARLIAPGLAEKLGQPVVVENRPGAGGTIAAAAVANATDGHTLLVANAAPISVSPFLLPSLPYEPMKAFAHVAFLGATPNVLLVHPSVPVRDYAQFVAWAKARGDGLSIGTSGVGSVGHIVLEMLNRIEGTRAQHVPYRGSGPMIADLLGGSIQVGVDTLPQTIDPMKTGQLRGILLTAERRSPSVPDLPSAGDLGKPGLVAENWIGLSVPASLPATAQARLGEAAGAVLAQPAVATRMAEWGFVLTPMTPAAFTAYIAHQAESWGPAIRASGATLN